MDKSDVCLMTGSVLITAALIMWETFGMMITPTVLTVAAAGCFLATVLCAAREEELRSRKKKGAEPTKVPAPKKNYYAFSIRREKRKSND